MTSQSEKKIIIIAGPNGAGKTTFAEEFLPQEASCPIFLNADLIAEELAYSKPERVAFRAGRLMLDQISYHVEQGDSFALETTLSGQGYTKQIPAWRDNGYVIKLFFIRLASSDLAMARVRRRVSMGGHDIPPLTIIRRFSAGRRNLEKLYKPLVDEWAVYDSSAGEPVLVEEGETMNTHAKDSRQKSQARKERDPDLVGAEAAIKRAAKSARDKAKQMDMGVIIMGDGQIIEVCEND